MATLIIGDVHGQLVPLRRLLAITDPATRLVFVGDLVGRGTDSLAVLRLVADLGDRAEVVLGNHDLHLLWTHASGHTTGGWGMNDLLAATDADELCAWLRSRRLALSVSEARALVVHAGAWPTWDVSTTVACAREVEEQLRSKDYARALTDLYGNDELRWDAGLTGAQRCQASVNILTRMRVCRADGRLDWEFGGRPSEMLPAGSCAWFDLPRRALVDVFVVCGHWSGLGLFVRADIAMLDTGCCFGGPLTGLWLETRRLVFAT